MQGMTSECHQPDHHYSVLCTLYMAVLRAVRAVLLWTVLHRLSPMSQINDESATFPRSTPVPSSLLTRSTRACTAIESTLRLPSIFILSGRFQTSLHHHQAAADPETLGQHA